MGFQVMPVVIDLALHQLDSLVHNSEAGGLWHANDELMSLKTVLSRIKTHRLDMDEMQSPDRGSSDWSSKLKDAVYDASDFIDLLSTTDLEIKVDKSILPQKGIRFLYVYPSKILEMKTIRGRLGEIEGQKRKHGFLEQQSQVVGTTNYGKSYPLFQRSVIVGREEDRKWMVSHLLSYPNHEVKRIDVIPIIGMGGMGKTTLAQLVFNDNDIADHFNRRLWAYVPGKFDLNTVIRKIIWSGGWNGWTHNMYMPSGYLSELNLWELRIEVQYVLRCEDRPTRVLLVLDDLWIEDCDQWETFMELLSECSVGSKIIVTTRSKDVSHVIGATEEHLLGALSADDSWSLFARKVFTEEGEEEAHPELVKLGMHSLVPKCKGNPLAIELLAGCLRTERDDQSWKRIAETELRLTDQITHPVIGMCFNQLPYNLKACFAFCSLFEKGSLYSRSGLIRLWSAEGLLQPPEQAESIEDAGNKCFDELILRSFFQVLRFDDIGQTYPGRVERVEMHDLIHDLAVCVAGKETATVNSRNSHDVSAAVRHIVWEREDLAGKQFPVELEKANRAARTFIFMHPMGSLSKSFLEGLLSNFKLLRVLMLSGSMFEELPDIIGDLKLLRLLALSHNFELEMLPDSTCNLVNLQTLDICRCNRLEKLPKNLQKLINLRNLTLTFNLRRFPRDALCGWISLERLHIVKCRHLESLSEDFGCLKKLRVLEIATCHELASLPDSMKSLNSIEELKIQDCWKLDLEGWKGLRGLSRLRHLVFVGLPRMREFPDGFDSAASSLHCLEIGKCERLEMLPKGLERCTSLLKLELHDCKKLRALPGGLHALKNLRELRVESCPELAAELKADEGFNWAFIAQIPSVSLDFKPQSASMDDDTHNNADTKNQCTNTDSSLVPKMQGQEIELQGDDKSKGNSIDGVTPMAMGELQRFPSSPKETDGRFDVPSGSTWNSKENSISAEIGLTTVTSDGTFEHTFTYNRHRPPVNQFIDELKIEDFESDEQEIEDFSATELTVQGLLSLPKEAHVYESDEQEIEDFSSTESAGRGLLSPPNEAHVSESDEQKGEVARSSDAMENVMKELKDSINIFSLLPHDYEFERETILQLWMAGETITVEDEGDPLITSLIKNECIWCSGTNFVTGTDQYRMDIEKIKSHLDEKNGVGKFYFRWENGSNGILPSYGIEHVSLLCDDIDAAEIFLILEKCSKLRTLLFTHNYGRSVTNIPYNLFLFLRELQILDLSRTQIKDLPSSLRCLTHLRFLDLSWTPIAELPEVICFLNELQTLKLKGCSNLRRLPDQMKMLTSLRNLELDVLHQLATMPVEIGALTNLRILSAFLVGTKDGHKILELKNLNNLTGNFCIAGLENVRSNNEAIEADLSSKVHLKELELRWTAPELMDMDDEQKIYVDAVERLEPPSSLEELKILCYRGSKLPRWSGDPKFAKLVRVTFFRCENVEEFPPVDQLPLLRHLSLVKMNGIRAIHHKVSEGQVAFPALEELRIIEMRSLETWVWGQPEENDFSLSELIINDCPLLNLLKFPHLSSLKCFEIRGCPKLKEYLSGEKIEFKTDEDEESDEDEETEEDEETYEDFDTSTDESEAQPQNGTHEDQDTY